MNSKNLSNGIVLGLALPLFLLAAGCDHSNSNNDATPPNATAAGTNGPAVNADNSAKNERDRNNTTLTPGDQGTSDADRQITQKVRQMLVSSTNDFSTTAKNVKIMTDSGKVTLRGPVNTDAEKTAIGAIANNVAGDGNVNNQLEVKTN